QGRQPRLVEELGDRPARRSIGEDHVAEPGRALIARPLVELVEEAARLGGGAGDTQAADDRTLVDGSREDGEAAAPEDLGDVLEHEGIAQVGLVAAVARERLVVGDAGKGWRRDRRLRTELR